MANCWVNHSHSTPSLQGLWVRGPSCPQLKLGELWVRKVCGLVGRDWPASAPQPGSCSVVLCSSPPSGLRLFFCQMGQDPSRHCRLCLRIPGGVFSIPLQPTVPGSGSSRAQQTWVNLLLHAPVSGGTQCPSAGSGTEGGQAGAPWRLWASGRASWEGCLVLAGLGRGGKTDRGRWKMKRQKVARAAVGHTLSHCAGLWSGTDLGSNWTSPCSPWRN